jgi:hypothetical protein
MDRFVASRIAMETPSGTPAFYMAEAVCMMRGKDPWAMETPTGMTNWQMIIFESLMSQAIVEAAMSAQLGRSICFPYGAPEPNQRNADDMGLPPRQG